MLTNRPKRVMRHSTAFQKTSRTISFLLVILLAAGSAIAWVYPEHRAIMLLAIKNLTPQRRAVLDRIWEEARIGHEDRLTIVPADFEQGEKPTRIDLGAWPAISGDHSCSPQDLLEIVLRSDWILEVADITARLNTNIQEAENRAERDNAMRDADIQLQRADPEYATRAGGNAIHYPLGRPSTETTPKQYFNLCLKEGAEMNAVGAYLWYHYSALLKAGRYAAESLSNEERASLARAMLADEAYALHFLQDLFAAGHAAVTRGSSAIRKGTHDYYNEYGFETRLWTGTPVVLLGDVYMRPQDAELAANAIQLSLEQVLDASVNKGQASGLKPKELVPSAPDTMDGCMAWTMPARDVDSSIAAPFIDVIQRTPVPGLAEGFGELPRFRAEIGLFIGIASSLRGGTMHGGFGSTQNEIGAIAGLDASFRIGVGLEGVMNKSGDGLAFLDIGVRRDSPSTISIADLESVKQFGTIFAAVPSRGAIVTRVRLPFWLLPGDLLLATPFLIFTSPTTLTKMAVEASNGGFIPWQTGLNTSFGRFQFILGREVGFVFYGYSKIEDRLLIPKQDAPDEVVLVSLRSIQFEFPVLEYRPFRTFSFDQSSSLVFQFYFGFDVPQRIIVVRPEGDPVPAHRTIWHTGLRVAFDWRSYLGDG